MEAETATSKKDEERGFTISMLMSRVYRQGAPPARLEAAGAGGLMGNGVLESEPAGLFSDLDVSEESGNPGGVLISSSETSNLPVSHRHLVEHQSSMTATGRRDN